MPFIFSSARALFKPYIVVTKLEPGSRPSFDTTVVFGPFPSTNASIVLILDMPGLYTYRVVLFNEQGWAHRSSTPQCLTILPNWRLHSMLDRSVSGFNLRAIARLRSLTWKCVLCSSAERPVGALGPIDSLHRGMLRYLMTMDVTNPGNPALGALWSSLAVGFLRMEDLTSAANAVEQVFPAPIRSIHRPHGLWAWHARSFSAASRWQRFRSP